MNERINNRRKSDRRVLEDSVERDRRVADRGIGNRDNKELAQPPVPLSPDTPADDEQCAHVVFQVFCGFYFAKHIGSFQHEFVRPPIWDADSSCSNCGAKGDSPLILKAGVINGEVKILCNKPGCFKTASTIRLREPR